MKSSVLELEEEGSQVEENAEDCDHNVEDDELLPTSDEGFHELKGKDPNSLSQVVDAIGLGRVIKLKCHHF